MMHDEKSGRLRTTSRRIVYTLAVILFLADFSEARHAGGSWIYEEWYGFYALYGAAAIILATALMRLVGRFIIRDTNNHRDDGND